MSAPLTDRHLAEIQDRDDAKAGSAADADLRQAEADRRVLLAEVRRLRIDLSVALPARDTLKAGFAEVCGERGELAKRIASAHAEISDQLARNHVADCGSPVNSLVERVLGAVETHLVDPECRPGAKTAPEGTVAPAGAAEPAVDASGLESAQRGAVGRDGSVADRSEP